eukprot:gene19541-23410_t
MRIKLQLYNYLFIFVAVCFITTVQSYAVDIATRNYYINAYTKELNELLVLHNQSMPGKVHHNNRLKALQATSTTHPIKIAHQTELLANGAEPQTCYSVNQVVVIGDKGTTSQGPCSLTQFAPCTYTCKAEDVITQSVRDLLTKALIPDLQAALAEKIYVKGPATTILPGTTDCGEFINMLVSYTTTGFSGDVAVWIYAHPSDKVGIGGYASYCLRSSSNGRPVAGRLNITPSGLTALAGTNSGFAYDAMVKLMMHETSHILVFSSDLFGKFIVQLVSLIVQRTYINTPNVLSFVRTHYACNSLAGGELEPIGGVGSVGSHWRPLSVGNELMDTNGGGATAPFTNLTLAVYYEVMGKTSACFEVEAATGGQKSFCYPQRCNGNNIEIQMGSTWYACTSPGQSVSTGSGITIKCPSDYTPCINEPLNIPSPSAPTTPTPTPTPTKTPTPTPTPTPTNTPKPTDTPTPSETTPSPTQTVTPTSKPKFVKTSPQSKEPWMRPTTLSTPNTTPPPTPRASEPTVEKTSPQSKEPWMKPTTLSTPKTTPPPSSRASATTVEKTSPQSKEPLLKSNEPWMKSTTLSTPKTTPPPTSRAS